MIPSLFQDFQTRKKIKKLEERVFELEKRLSKMQAINNLNLIRVKNNQFIPDQSITTMSPYIDLSAFKAHELTLNEDEQYYFIDVEESTYQRPVKLDNLLNIPLSNILNELEKLPSSTISLFIISKDGLKSIKACELLSSKGFYNCYNISGGYEKWPKSKLEGLGQTLD